MILDKAIELGKEAVISLKKGKFHDHADAINLLIEAGKRLTACREPAGGSPLPPLAGETPADSPT